MERANLARVRASIGRNAAPHGCCVPKGLCGAGNRAGGAFAAALRAGMGLRRPKAPPLESAGDLSPDPFLDNLRSDRVRKGRLEGAARKK